MSPTSRKTATTPRRSASAEDTSTCQHSGCDCPVPSGEEYCSDACRPDAGKASTRAGTRKATSTGPGCGCGHAGCGEN
jgi:hypothetical protein